MFGNKENYIVTLAGIMILALAVVDSTAQQSSRPDRGFGGGGGFQTTDIDSISLQNGGLNLHIPLASLPPMAGGKLGYTLQATYNSKLWDIHRSENQVVAPPCPDRYATQEVWGADGGAGWRIGGGYEIFFRYADDDFTYQQPTSEQCDGYDYNYMMMGDGLSPC